MAIESNPPVVNEKIAPVPNRSDESEPSEPGGVADRNRNKPRQGFSDWLASMSISTRFRMGLGMLLGLMVITVVVGLLSESLVRRAEESIETSHEIERLVLEMNASMEKARRLHADFFLQYPRIGLSSAHEQYAQPAVRQIAHAIATSQTLKDRIDRSPVSDRLRSTQTDLNLFWLSARRFADTAIASVERVTELVGPDGWEPRMVQILAKMDDEIADVSELRAPFAQLQLFTKEYRITRKRPWMQSAFNEAALMRQRMLSIPGIDPKRVDRIGGLLDRFGETADKLLEIDSDIRATFHDFALQAQATNAVSQTLVQFAQDEVIRAKQRIQHSRALAIGIALGFLCLALAGAFSIARMLDRRITRRILRLTRAAEAFQQGRLEERVALEGKDEIGTLAGAFNAMAERIRLQVDTLEEKVRERTAALQKSERRFRELFTHSTNGVAIFEAVEAGSGFVFRDVNAAWEKIDGIHKADVIGKDPVEVSPAVRELGLSEVIQRAWRSGSMMRHSASREKDGQWKECVFREFQVYRLSSGEIVVVMEDLTDRKRAEMDRAEMETRLHQAQKMETIGLLAGGVAHDLNNILSGIVTYPELLLFQLPPDSPLRKTMQVIQESGKRAAAVVSDLLTMARGVASAKKEEDLNRLVEEYIHSPEGQNLIDLHPHVSYRLDLSADLSPVLCSRIHVTKCIMNIVTNAMEAIHGEGKVVISSWNETLDDETAVEFGIRPGPYSVIGVSDTGPGIAEKDVPHIFEPFYTRKVMGKSGSGLGLTVVWNSIVDLGGTVRVKTGPEGTLFKLYFPASATPIKEKEKPRAVADLHGRGEKILVVDDDPLQRDIAEELLKALQYEAVCVSSGEEALAYVQAHPVDLVLLDMVMDPGINGYETYRRMITIRPGLKAVIASGFSDSEDVRNTLALGAGGLIAKPYSMETLGKAIQSQLS